MGARLGLLTSGHSSVPRSTHPPKVPQEQLCYGLEILQGVSGLLKTKIKLCKCQLPRCFGDFTPYTQPTHLPGDAGACSMVHMPWLGCGTPKPGVHSPQAHKQQGNVCWQARQIKNPGVCCVFVLLTEVAGPHSGTNLAMSQGTASAKEKIQLFHSVF